MQSLTKSYLDKDVINNISNKVFNEDAKSFEELTGGWYNSAYDVETVSGKHGILKIEPPTDVKIMGYEKDIMEVEVEVMKKVREKTNVPIPEIYCYDTSKDIIPQQYFIMEKLDGKPLNEIRQSLDEQIIESIESKLGKYNRCINGYSNDEFGLYASSQPKFCSWYKAFKSIVQLVLDDGEELKVDIGMPYEKIVDIIDSLKEVLNVVKEPKLVHWDLWDGNIFIDDEKIVGLIDFERALWADPLMEISFWASSKDYFINGYGQDIKGELYFDIRRNLYALYTAIIMVVECKFRGYKGITKDRKKHLRNRFEIVKKAIDNEFG